MSIFVFFMFKMYLSYCLYQYIFKNLSCPLKLILLSALLFWDSTNCQFPIFQVVYEDLPSNLCAIRDFVETRGASMSDLLNTPDEPIPVTDNHADIGDIRPVEVVPSSPHSSTLKQRPKVPGLQRDFEVLKAEILAFISEHGQEGFMPMRKQLRLHGRVDIEKAITHMGGFRKVANSMNLALAYKHRKPRGYWDNLENLQEEVTLPGVSFSSPASCRQ